MSFIFPPNPSVGQQVTGPNGFTYVFDGKGWVTLGGGDFVTHAELEAALVGNPVYSGPTAPSNPQNGDLWFDTTVNELKSWNGSAWVASAAQVEGFLPLSGGVMTGPLWAQNLGVRGQTWLSGPIIGNPMFTGALNVQGGIYYWDSAFLAEGGRWRINVSSDYFQIAGRGGTTRIQIHPDGSCWNVSGTWNAMSDSRVKSDIAIYDRGLAAIEKLDPIIFRYNGQGGAPLDDEDTTRVGLDAEATSKVFPEAVRSRVGEIDGAETNVLGTDTGPLIFALVNAVKELSARLEVVETRA